MIRFDVAPIPPRSRGLAPQPASSASEARPSPAPAPTPVDDDELPRGCGWYVSSHDLERGLELSEFDLTDADLPPHLLVALRFG
jgi:hypothetical protein